MELKQWSTIAMVLCLIVTLSIALAAPAAATPATQGSSSPLQLVKKRVDLIIDVLNDPQLSKPENRTAQRDKIWDIANMYEVEVRALMRWNNLSLQSRIFPGDQLLIILGESEQ